MKKLFVLVAALLLVGLVAGADSHAGVTTSGKIEIRGKTDMEDEVYTPAGVVELKFDAVIDDNTKAYIELEEAGSGLTPYASPFDRAHFTVDLGGALDLPVGVEVNAGFNEFKSNDGIKVTKGEYEDQLGTGFTTWGYEITVMPVADMDVALQAGFGADWDTEEFYIGAYGTVDPVTAEVYYVVDTDTKAEDAIVEGGAEFGMEVADGIMLGAAATAKYTLADVADGVSALFYSAGVDVNYMEDLARLGVALRGEQEEALGGLAIYLSSSPAEGFEAFLSVGLAVAEAYATDNAENGDPTDLATFGVKNPSPESGLDSVDFGLSYKVGGATFYAGYLYSVEGGAIAKEWAEIGPPEYDATDASTWGMGAEGAIYLRGKVEF